MVIILFDFLKIFQLKILLGYLKNNTFPDKLSEEEETECINNLFIKEKMKDARTKLILHNLRLVAHIASKYKSKDEDNDDLISLGTIGLIKAIDTYSADKNVRLATYASRCIENEILMTLRSNKKHAKNVSFSDTIGTDKDGSEIELIDVLTTGEESVEDTVIKNQNIEELRKYINILDEREYQIISLRYGLNNNEEKTQKEIAKEFNISRSYVSRIEKRALSKLLLEFRKNQKY